MFPSLMLLSLLVTNVKGDLSEVSLKKGTYTAFVKLHIEQGPILEKGVLIGVVTAIAAPASIKVTFEGNGGHAGAALMLERNDAELATAELALAVEKHVLNSGSVDTVGTVGELLDCLRDPSGMTIAMLLESIAAKILLLSFFTPSKLIEDGIMICFYVDMTKKIYTQDTKMHVCDEKKDEYPLQKVCYYFIEKFFYFLKSLDLNTNKCNI